MLKQIYNKHVEIIAIKLYLQQHYIIEEYITSLILKDNLE